MSDVEFFWRLPTHGDGRRAHDRHTRGEWNKLPPERRVAPGVRDGRPDGFTYVDYLGQIARAAEISGFDGALVPVSGASEQPWIVAAALARETRRLRFLVAHQAGFATPHFTAQSAATLQRVSGGRLDINIITGAESGAQRAIGDFLDHDARYERTGDFLDAFRGIWSNPAFDHQGPHFRIENGGFKEPLAGAPIPKIYFAGYSEPALEVAARHADVYLTWAEPLANTREVFDKVRRAAQRTGRAGEIRFGVRIDIIARETSEQAWNEVRALFRTATADTQKAFDAQGRRKRSAESTGAQRQWALHQGKTDDFDQLIVGPNLWAGMSLIRGGPSCGLIGSYEEIAERLVEYVEAGASNFILASTPHLEEAYHVGEEVLPLVRRRLAEGVRSDSTIRNTAAPLAAVA